MLFSGSGSSSGSGGAGLRKYTLFPLERAADRLLARKGILQVKKSTVDTIEWGFLCLLLQTDSM